MRLRSSISIAIGFLLLALLAGCGGGGDSSSSSNEASGGEGATTVTKTWKGSKQAFIKKAVAFDVNFLCFDPVTQSQEFAANIQEELDLRYGGGSRRNQGAEHD